MAKETGVKYELTAAAKLKGSVLVRLPDGRMVDLVGNKAIKFKRVATKNKPETEGVYEPAKEGDLELYYKSALNKDGTSNQKIVRKIGREATSNEGLISG